jgi:hypothetical protein
VGCSSSQLIGKVSHKIQIEDGYQVLNTATDINWQIVHDYILQDSLAEQQKNLNADGFSNITR